MEAKRLKRNIAIAAVALTVQPVYVNAQSFLWGMMTHRCVESV
jgi:hypothetical protein